MAISGASTDTAWKVTAVGDRVGPTAPARAPAHPLPEPRRPSARGGLRGGDVAGLRSALGVALLPCALAATLAWLAFLLWLAVALVGLPFR